MAETKFTEQARAWEKGDVMINGVYLTFCKMGKDIPLYWKVIKRSYKKAHDFYLRIKDKKGSQLIQLYYDEDERMWKNIVPNDDKWLKYNSNNYAYIIGYND